jgi:hypothetical protein
MPADKSDEQRAREACNASFYSEADEEGCIAQVLALIQAVRAERDAELALDRAIVEAAERWAEADGAYVDDSYPRDRALLEAVRAKRFRTPPPPRDKPSAETQHDMPEMQCPQCGAVLPDFDGFGVLAHTKPAYPDGCGYCSHPSRDDGVCGICGDGARSFAADVPPKDPTRPAHLWDNPRVQPSVETKAFHSGRQVYEHYGIEQPCRDCEGTGEAGGPAFPTNDDCPTCLGTGKSIPTEGAAGKTK